MKAVLLDFDGVICDSINECYIVSSEVFFGFSRDYLSNEKHKELFYRYRGLVKPAHQYIALHKTIVSVTEENNNIDLFLKIFEKYDSGIPDAAKKRYTHLFFENRAFHKKNMDVWLQLNPLTNFGKSLAKKKLDHHFVVTAKDKESVEMIFDYNGINIPQERIFAKDEYEQFGDKGKMATYILDKFGYDEAEFIDDATEHLDSIKDSRVKCFFADWGYGDNTTYPLYNY